jgi:hypothetical protein
METTLICMRVALGVVDGSRYYAKVYRGCKTLLRVTGRLIVVRPSLCGKGYNFHQEGNLSVRGINSGL